MVYILILFTAPKYSLQKFLLSKIAQHNLRFDIKSVQPRKIEWQRDVNRKASTTYG